MAPKTSRENFVQLAKDAFPNGDASPYSKEFLTATRENWREAGVSFSRSTMTMFFFSIVFFLLALGKIGKVSAGPIEVNDLLLIQLVLPAIIAYFFYDACNLAIRQIDLRDMYFSTLAVVYPNIPGNGLELFLAPVGSSIFGAYPLDTPAGKVTRGIMQFFTNVIQYVFLSGVGFFQVIAFSLNLERFDSLSVFNRAVFVLSEIVTAVLMIYGVYFLLATPARKRPIELASLD